ncbi:hypothetical protein [Hoylesella saccharolytica]|uniref:hypothetical protein n=1 Tax=Hoylesella saccharolytica TaxID=633701 RepID=UPI0028E44DE3|nr:hypothetical protein [Hoylesella saccharolytica]
MKTIKKPILDACCGGKMFYFNKNDDCVLKPGGFLIFKWNETDIKVTEILKLTPERPVFGHISGKRANTHWICFMKNR